MKQLKLLFAMLCLSMISATGFAQKYYPTVRASVLEEGKQYMIYDANRYGDRTAFRGATDEGGLKHTQTKPSVFITADATYLWTIEKISDEKTAQNRYYLRSNNASKGYSNGYNQTNSTTPIEIYIEPATSTNAEHQDWEAEDGSVVTYDATQLEAAGLFVIRPLSGWGWNGASNGSWAGWSTGHPYAFYEVEEVPQALFDEYAELQELAYQIPGKTASECFALQGTYGVQDAATKYICSNPETGDNGDNATKRPISTLTDGDTETFYHTSYTATGSTDHYIQVEMASAVDEFCFYMYPRTQNTSNRPQTVVVSGSNEADGTYVDIATVKGISMDHGYLSYKITSPTAYKYLRFTVTSTNTGSRYFTLSEFYVLSSTTDEGKTALADAALRNVDDLNPEYYRNAVTMELIDARMLDIGGSFTKNEAKTLLDANEGNHSETPALGQYETRLYNALKTAYDNCSTVTIENLEALNDAMVAFKPNYGVFTINGVCSYATGKSIYDDGQDSHHFKTRNANDRQMLWEFGTTTDEITLGTYVVKNLYTGRTFWDADNIVVYNTNPVTESVYTFKTNGTGAEIHAQESGEVIVRHGTNDPTSGSAWTFEYVTDVFALALTVKGEAQALLDANKSNHAENPIPGQYPTTSWNDLQTAITNAVGTLDGILALAEAMETFKNSMAKPVAGQFYMFVNQNPDYTTMAMYSDGDLKWKKGESNHTHNNFYWTLEADGDKFKVKNGDGRYMVATEGGNEHGNFSMTDDAASATPATFATVNNHAASWNISLTGHTPLHPSSHEDSDGFMMGYNGELETTSAWKLQTISGYDVYNVTIVNGGTEGYAMYNGADKAYDGGFFVIPTDTEVTDESFTALNITGKGIKITVDTDTKTVTVTYKDLFIPTTLVDGNFAEDTKWYFMQITGSKYHIYNNGTERMMLTPRAYWDDEELWCCVEQGDGSYKIYNKAAGPSKVLAASTTMSGDNGSKTYPSLQEDGNLPDGYVGTWVFQNSSKIAGADGLFIRLNDPAKGNIDKKPAMNKRNDYLAFWSEGADAGSTFIFTQGTECTIDLTTGTEWTGTGYHSTWSSTQIAGLTFGTGSNNMKADNDDANLISIFPGSGGCTYTITAPAGYVIKSYSFDYKLRSDNPDATVNINGTNASTTSQTFAVNDCNTPTASFTQGGANKGVTLSNFQVVLCKPAIPREAYVEVLPAPHKGVVHRIPAIAQAKNGDIIAVADYRYSGQDIGLATGKERRLDLNFNISHDNGKTWDGIQTLIAGQGAPQDNLDVNDLDVAYGDPCIVVDRESGKVLVMSCAGNVSFTNGTADKHQYIVAMYSEDNGAHWTTANDVTRQFYSKFDECTIGTPNAMFIGSGKISQSRYIKKGDYYRIYCAVLYEDVNDVRKNYVFYSDDFGTTWNVLGGVNVSPIPNGADEPKADELPDGSVVCSSRINGGRKYNIFHYTDPINAEGSWGTVATSSSSNNGVVAQSNSTNGEIITVPVKRKADHKKMFLFLQSVPLGPNRANVGIYYKALESLADFDTPAHLSADWDGHYQACYFNSCYSTMTWLKNNTLAFLYEEDLNNSEYSIVYKNYTIDKLTGDKYEYCSDVDSTQYMKDAMSGRMATLNSFRGPYVGNLTDNSYMDIEQAYDAYIANPSKTQYTAFNQAVENAEYRALQADTEYRVQSYLYPARYFNLLSTGLTTETLDESSAAQKITFTASGSGWSIKGDATWLGNTATANETSPAIAETLEGAAVYEIVSNKQGVSSFHCLTGEDHRFLHAKSGGKVVSWGDSEGSHWYIIPVVSDANNTLVDLVVECRDELEKAGKVGYPAADKASTMTFKEKFDVVYNALIEGVAVTTEQTTALTEAREAYKTETDIVLPKNGKAYRIYAVYGGGAKQPLYHDPTIDQITTQDETNITGKNAMIFVCTVVDGKFIFVNNTGKYPLWSDTGDSGISYSVKGYSKEYIEQNAWTISRAEVPDQGDGREGLTATDFFGRVQMSALDKNGTDSYYWSAKYHGNDGTHATFISENPENKWYDGNDNNRSHTFVIEEVEDYNNEIAFNQLAEASSYYVATYSAPYPTLIPEGVIAYSVSETDDVNVVETYRLEGAGTAIPANTGVLLAARSAIEPKTMVPATNEDVKTVPSGNLLVGTGATGTTVADDVNAYILANRSSGIGFYKLTTSGNRTIDAYRAYLDVPVVASSRKLRVRFDDGTETDINNILDTGDADNNVAIYDLSGRRIQKPVKGSLYIKDGVKYIHQ